MEAAFRRCINCSLRLQYTHSLLLSEVNDDIFNTLATWITPTPISHDDLLCTECFMLLQNALEATPAPAPAFGHKSVCFVCGISITYDGLRSSKVPAECEERNIITNCISPHLVPHLERVCSVCMKAVKRNVQKKYTINTIQSPGPLLDLFHRQRRKQKPKIISLMYKRIVNRGKHCVFPNCEETKLCCVPVCLRQEILSRRKIYISKGVQICKFHLHTDCWDQLEVDRSDFNDDQMDDMLGMLERIEMRNIQFIRLNNVPP